MDYDRTDFLLFRYTFQGWFANQFNSPTEYEVLTEEGFKPIQENVEIPKEYKIPTISGLDRWNDERMMERLDQFETHIRQVIKHEQG